MAYQSQTEGILWEEKERRRMGDRQTQQAITTVSTQEKDEAPLHQPRGCWSWQSHCSSLLWFLSVSLSFLYVVKREMHQSVASSSSLFLSACLWVPYCLPNFPPPFFVTDDDCFMYRHWHKSQLLPQGPYGARRNRMTPRAHLFSIWDPQMTTTKKTKTQMRQSGDTTNALLKTAMSIDVFLFFFIVPCLQVLFREWYWSLCILPPQW